MHFSASTLWHLPNLHQANKYALLGQICTIFCTNLNIYDEITLSQGTKFGTNLVSTNKGANKCRFNAQFGWGKSNRKSS